MAIALTLPERNFRLPSTPTARPWPRAGAETGPTVSIAVGICLPSALWSGLLAQALNQLPGLEATVGPSAVLAPPTATAAGSAGVLVTALPGARAGWEKLASWGRRGERVRVLVLGEQRPALAARALRAGASGYLDWESPLAVLAKAIRGVQAGELWAERKVALTLLHSPAEPPAPLTARELIVLEALAEGKRNKEIAAQLAISEATVKSHLNRVYHKLHLSDRLQAALYVERHGLTG
ncbi:MAG: response regulator transcription factor [Terriglobales bacterium]